MKKVLILAYDFPPYVSVGGLRPHSWYLYLKNNNIEPIVITRQWDNKNANSLDYISKSLKDYTVIEETEKGTILKTKYNPNFANRLILKYGYDKWSTIRKLYSGMLEIFQYLFVVGTKKEIYKEAQKYLENNEVDYIIATGEPFILFKYASKLSQKFSIPWVADYRDPWSQNEERTKYFPFNFLFPFLEKKITKTASRITTASPFFKDIIQTVFPQKQISIIANGYNQEFIDTISNIKQNDKILIISYVGTIYKWHPVESFLQVCNELLKKKSEFHININFYGINNSEEIKQLINKKYIHLIDSVFVIQKMPNDKLLETLAKSNLLLLFNYYSFIGTKIYDYLALNRKIILCYSNDAQAEKLKNKYYDYNTSFSKNNHIQEDVIGETNSGIIIQDENHLKETLIDLYKVFKKEKTIVSQNINVSKYSRKHQTKKLAQILDSLQ